MSIANKAASAGVDLATRLRVSFWMIASVLAILVATGVLAVAVYFAAVAIFGIAYVQKVLAQIGSYPVKSMHVAPADVQSLFFVMLTVLFFCLAVPCILAGFVAARKQWREPIALVSLQRSLPLLWIAAFVLAVPVFLIGASLIVKLIEPGFSTWFFVPAHPAGLALSFVAVVVMAPLAEELLFRGWIYTGLRKAFRASTTVMVTTLIFALAHSDGGMLYPLAVFIPGLALALIRHWTGSVWASFAAHALYNAWAWGLVLVLGKDLV